MAPYIRIFLPILVIFLYVLIFRSSFKTTDSVKSSASSFLSSVSSGKAVPIKDRLARAERIWAKATKERQTLKSQHLNPTNIELIIAIEEELIERTNCEIYGFDFSVGEFGKQLKPEAAARAHFMKVGIAGTTDLTRDPPFYTIQDLMVVNGHDYIDVLKVDIEYFEFESLTSLLAAFPETQNTIPVGQILVEIHVFQGYALNTTNAFMAWWEALEARGFRASWTEPNLLAVTLHLQDGMPRLAEYTLINTNDPKSLILRD
ncbi:MAG: hypothetical protein M1827_001566 [Pycnora praestabilis]|nr:MAG: hypothetical protein M1827_001566 [Pycnora praestabilis]